MKAVCGLDVHKDSIYPCILHSDGELFEQVFGVLTFQLDTNMACAFSSFYSASGKPLFHQATSRS